jgi:hypothetical protein
MAEFYIIGLIAAVSVAVGMLINISDCLSSGSDEEKYL